MSLLIIDIITYLLELKILPICIIKTEKKGTLSSSAQNVKSSFKLYEFVSQIVVKEQYWRGQNTEARHLLCIK